MNRFSRPFTLFWFLYGMAYCLNHELQTTRYVQFGFMGYLLASFFFEELISRAGVTFFLLASGLELAWRLPDLANHENLLLIFNSILLGGMALVRGDVDRVFERVRPHLIACLLLIYFWTGFHKLNEDFLNPEVSCARFMLDELLSLLPGVRSLSTASYRGIAVLTLGIEIGAAFALLVARARPWVLALLISFHLALGFAGVFDFSALMIALFSVFLVAVPDDFSTRLKRSLLAVTVLNFGTMIVVTYGVRISGWSDHRTDVGQALIYALTVLGLLFTLGKEGLASVSKRLDWAGQGVSWLVTATLFTLFAFMPYLGLRNAGNLTMFSNLRTEAGSSNHLVFSGDRLRFFSYQDDLVWIRSLDPRVEMSAGVKYPRSMASLAGYGMPLVEFRNRIRGWKRWGLVGVKAELEYRGEIFRTEDLLSDSRWTQDGRMWEQAFLDFRPVQRDKPNRCRW